MLKWQQGSGTAEQKVPFEAMCLAEAVLTSQDRYHKAYLMLGSGGWKLRDFFVGGDLERCLRHSNGEGFFPLPHGRGAIMEHPAFCGDRMSVVQ